MDCSYYHKYESVTVSHQSERIDLIITNPEVFRASRQCLPIDQGMFILICGIHQVHFIVPGP